MRTALLLAFTLTACGSDSGTAPAITALTFAPATVTHGVQTTVTGTFTFTDEDGDLAELTGEVVLPDQTRQMFAKTDLSGVGDMTTGTLAFQMTLVPPSAGAYQFELWITDDGDNESNRLGGTLTAN